MPYRSPYERVYFKKWVNLGITEEGYDDEVEVEVTVIMEGSRSEGWDLHELYVVGAGERHQEVVDKLSEDTEGLLEEAIGYLGD